MAEPFIFDPQEEEKRRLAAVEALAQQNDGWAPNDSFRENPIDVPLVSQEVADQAKLETPQRAASKAPDPFGGLDPMTIDMPATPALPDPAAEGTAHPNALGITTPVADWQGALAAQQLEPVSDGPDSEPDNDPDDKAKATSALADAGKEKPAETLAASASTSTTPTKHDPWEALMQRGEEEKQKALAAMGEEPGINGWALLADIAFNKGHSIPGIISQSENDKRQWREARQKLLTGGGKDPLSGMLELERLKVAAGREGRLQTAADNKVASDALKAEAAKGSRAAMLELMRLNGASEEKIKAASALDDRGWAQAMPSLRLDYKLSDPMVEKAATLEGSKAHQRAKETVLGEAEVAGTKANTAGQVRLAQDQADAEVLGTRPQTPEQIAAREHQLEREAVQDEQTRRNNERQDRIEQRTNENLSATRQQTFGKSIEKTLPVAKELQGIEDIIANHEAKGEPVPGVGMRGHGNALAGSSLVPQAVRDQVIEWSNDPKTRQEAIEATKVRGFIGNFEQDLIHNRSGAAFTANEEQMNKISAGARAGAPLEAVKVALQTIHEIVGGKIGGFASVAPSEAASFLTGAGLAPERWMNAAPAAPAASGGGGGMGNAPARYDIEAAPTTNRGGAAGSGAQDNLGQAPVKRIPRAPAGPVGAEPKSNVVVVMPGGQRRPAQLSQREMNDLLKQHPDLQIEGAR